MIATIQDRRRVMEQFDHHHGKDAPDPSSDLGSGPTDGAHSFRPTDRRSDIPGSTAYRVLHQLLARQAARENREQLSLATGNHTRDLLAEVVRASADGVVELEMFAQLPPAIALGERPYAAAGHHPADATSEVASNLLGSRVAWRDSQLLLARSQTLSQAWYLAAEAALNDQQVERSGYLRNLSALMKDLHRRTVALMRAQLSLTRK